MTAAQDDTWWPAPFGADDQHGMLNHITEATRLAALRQVRTGRMYDLGRVLDETVPVFPGRYFRQTLVTTAHHTNGGPGGGLGDNDVNWVIEYVSATTQLGTHLDMLNHVHGQRGSDPTEPPAAEPYPYPPVSHEPRIQRLSDDLTRTGHRPFPLPVGVMLDETDRKHSPCVRCTRLDGFPCLVDAKADAHVVAVRPALKHPGVTLLRRTRVERLETDPGGRTVTRVVVDHEGLRETYSGDVVVVSCGAVNSAALLLRSANDVRR